MARSVCPSALPFYGRVLIRRGTDGHKAAGSGPSPAMSVSSHINYSLVTSRKEPFVCRLSEITGSTFVGHQRQAAAVLTQLHSHHGRDQSAHGTEVTLHARTTIQRGWYCFQHVQKLVWRSHITFASNIISKNTSASLVAPWRQRDRWFEQTHLKIGTKLTVSWSWADRETLSNSCRLSKHGWRMLRDYSREQHRHSFPP
jgi:hypothetical protein